MGFRSHFRDQKEWLDSTNGCMKLNVRSDEAAKQYDAAVSQICGWYDDESIGGLDATISRMIAADEEFVLGKALKYEIELMGALTAPHLNKELKDQIDGFNSWVEQKREKGQVNDQELLHCDVVNHWASGNLKLAVLKLERLVTLYPEDVIALKIIQDTNFMLGTALPMRNSLAASLAKMSSKNPLKGYVHGMFSFALEESNIYDRAQVEATKALSLIPFDTWAIHNYAHCLEMQAKVEEGLKWMNDKRCDWEPCQTLACHQYWHTALFHINNNHFDDAVALLDNEILTRCKSSSSSLDLHDAASMLYRMELVDLFGKVADPKLKGDSLERWSGVYDMCLPHKRDHLLGFNDAHFMMSFLGKGDTKTAQELRDSISESPDLIVGDSVVRPLLDAMIEFHAKRYSRAVEILEPIRFDIIKIGGSHAQRDVFEQLLLVSALKSDLKEHRKLGERMLIERDAFHGKRVIQTELLAQQAN